MYCRVSAQPVALTSCLTWVKEVECKGYYGLPTIVQHIKVTKKFLPWLYVYVRTSK
jgi:hypothetical protein